MSAFNDLKRTALQALFGSGAPESLNDLEYAVYKGLANGSISLGGAEIVTFYSDWTTDGTAIRTIQDGDGTWSDGSTSSIESPATDITNNTRSSIALADITVPSGTTLDNYIIHYIEAQVYLIGTSATGWGFAGFHTVHAVDYKGRFTNATILGSNIIVQTGGSNTLYSNGTTAGHGFGESNSSQTDLPCRIKIVCSLK